MKTPVLHILVDCKDSPIHYELHIIDGTLTETYRETSRAYLFDSLDKTWGSVRIPLNSGEFEDFEDEIAPFLNILLFICSDEARFKEKYSTEAKPCSPTIEIPENAGNFNYSAEFDEEHDAVYNYFENPDLWLKSAKTTHFWQVTKAKSDTVV